MNIWDLTGHQLDVIRTCASVIGALGGFIGGAGAVGAFLARYWAKQAAHNTRREEWTDGKLHTVDVAELTSHTLHSTQELRGEITDLYNDPPVPREHGRRRLPTDTIRTIRKPGEDSIYE